jgi:hypothetical protein
VQLAVDIAEANVVQIDQGDVAQRATRQRFRRPGTDPAEADHAAAALEQTLQSVGTIKARQSAKAEVVVIHEHSIDGDLATSKKLGPAHPVANRLAAVATNDTRFMRRG